jgi:hypothetical protein
VGAYQASALCLRAHEVHKGQMEGRGDDEYEEELPSNVVESDGAGNEQDDIREVQAAHADCHALTPDMCREDFGPGCSGL